MFRTLFILTVYVGEKVPVFYAEWSKAIADSFEKYFWVPENSDEDSRYRIQSHLINRRYAIFGLGES